MSFSGALWRAVEILKAGGRRDAGGSSYDPAERSERTRRAWESRRRNAAMRAGADNLVAAGAALRAAGATITEAPPTDRMRATAQRISDRLQSNVAATNAQSDADRQAVVRDREAVVAATTAAAPAAPYVIETSASPLRPRETPNAAALEAADRIHGDRATFNTHARAQAMLRTIQRRAIEAGDPGGPERPPEMDHFNVIGSTPADHEVMRARLFREVDDYLSNRSTNPAGTRTNLRDHARSVNSFPDSPILSLRSELGEYYTSLRRNRLATAGVSGGEMSATRREGRQRFAQTLEGAEQFAEVAARDIGLGARLALGANTTPHERQTASRLALAAEVDVRAARRAPAADAKARRRAQVAESDRVAAKERAAATAARDRAAAEATARAATANDAVARRRRAIASLQPRAFATSSAPAAPTAPRRTTGSIFKRAVRGFIAKAGGKRDAGGSRYDPAERSRRTRLAWESRRRNAALRAGTAAPAAAPEPAPEPVAAAPVERVAERRRTVVPSAMIPTADFDMEPFATHKAPAPAENEPWESSRAPGVYGGTATPAVDMPRHTVRVSVSTQAAATLRAAYGADFDVAEMAKKAYGGYGWNVDVAISNVMSDGTFRLNITAPRGGMQVTREFRKDSDGKRYVYHAWQELPSTAQDKGSGTRVFYESLQEYDKMGIAYAKTTAGLSVGGYAWARMGFHAESPSSVADGAMRRLERLTIAGDTDGSKKRLMMDSIRASREKPLVTNIIAKLRNGSQEVGKELLLGSGFSGKMVFDKNHEDRQAFDQYAAQKLKLKKPALRSLTVSRFL